MQRNPAPLFAVVAQCNQAEGDAGAQQHHRPVHRPFEDAARERSHQERLRRREVLAELVGRNQQVQHQRNHQCPRKDADQLRNLLPPGSGADDVARLQVLQVVARNRTGAADEGGNADGRDDELLRAGAVVDQPVEQREERRGEDYDDNRHARNRVITAPEQPGHVARYRCEEVAGAEDYQQRQQRRQDEPRNPPDHQRHR